MVGETENRQVVSPKKEEIKMITATHLFMRFMFDYLPSNGVDFFGFFKDRMVAREFVDETIRVLTSYKNTKHINAKNFIDVYMNSYGGRRTLLGLYTSFYYDFMSWRVNRETYANVRRLWVRYLNEHVEGSFRTMWKTGKNSFKYKRAW